MRNSLLLLTALTLLGCGQGNERLIEKSRIEGREQAEADIKATNSNLANWASAMEEDLDTRHRFYQGIKGTYEGSITSGDQSFRVRINLVPNLSPYPVSRIRRLEEVVADLNFLSLHVQVLQWNPDSPFSAYGCRIEDIKPDMVRGEIAIASSSCPNLYRLYLFDPLISESLSPASDKKEIDMTHVSALSAQALREGTLEQISEIYGEIQPSTNASIFKISVKRKLFEESFE
jgi:hypothetical protein